MAVPPQQPYVLETLPHGAKLITAPLRERTSASIAVIFKVGSRYESEQNAGVSHFLEHMFFKGSERYGGAKEISEAIEGVGGILNAGTNKEATVYWAKVPGEKLELGIDVLCDMLFHSKLDLEEVEKERSVVLEELRMYRDSPQDQVHSLFERILWPNHPLGRDTAGTEESIQRLRRDDLTNHLDTHYGVANMVIAIAGRVDHEAARALLVDRLSLRGNGQRADFLPSNGAVRQPGLVLKQKKTEQAHVCFGVRCPSYLDAERYTVDILNTILGEGMSSRLFLQVREKRGFAYDVHSFTSKLCDTGALGIYAGTDPKRAAQAMGACIRETRRLCEELVSASELTKAKEYYKGRLLLAMETTDGVANRLGFEEVLMGRIHTLEERIAAVDAIEAEDVRRVARRIFEEQPLQAAVLGPFRSEAAFRRQIQ